MSLRSEAALNGLRPPSNAERVSARWRDRSVSAQGGTHCASGRLIARSRRRCRVFPPEGPLVWTRRNRGAAVDSVFPFWTRRSVKHRCETDVVLHTRRVVRGELRLPQLCPEGVSPGGPPPRCSTPTELSTECADTASARGYAWRGTIGRFPYVDAPAVTYRRTYR